MVCSWKFVDENSDWCRLDDTFCLHEFNESFNCLALSLKNSDVHRMMMINFKLKLKLTAKSTKSFVLFFLLLKGDYIVNVLTSTQCVYCMWLYWNDVLFYLAYLMFATAAVDIYIVSVLHAHRRNHFFPLFLLFKMFDKILFIVFLAIVFKIWFNLIYVESNFSIRFFFCIYNSNTSNDNKKKGFCFFFGWTRQGSS